MFSRFTRRRTDYRAAAAGLEGFGVAPAACQRFADFLETAHDHELFLFNPRALAPRLQLNERDTLRLLVAALHEGLVTLHWEVRCPRCGGIDHHSTSLSQVHSEEHCPACQMSFNPSLDDEVRVSFTLHERIRSLPTSADNLPHREQVNAQHGAVPGHALLALPLFRRLFPQERVLPDESLHVTRATLLFTDLAGSTALYARRGDPRAYHLVRRHFDVLFALADQQGGSAVKTIGDAIMAVFLNPVDGMEAALAMLRGVDELNAAAGLEGDDRLILKVGLHTGPCLSVTLNDRPDYFGSTVNIAARVQGLSHGCDVVFTEAVRADLQVRELLANSTLESSTVMLKGIEEAQLVHRMVVQ